MSETREKYKCSLIEMMGMFSGMTKKFPGVLKGSYANIGLLVSL